MAGYLKSVLNYTIKTIWQVDLIVQCMNCFVCFIKIASGNMKCV